MGMYPQLEPEWVDEVLLAGPAALSISGKFPARTPKLVSASAIEPTFDAAASRRTDVRVIVVDVDAFGVSLIRDLHTVFPSMKIVALTSGPKQMIASLKAGAAIALPRSTPASVLTRLVTRLLAKPVKAKPVNPLALAYLNRLSDFLFIAVRAAMNRKSDSLLR